MTDYILCLFVAVCVTGLLVLITLLAKKTGKIGQKHRIKMTSIEGVLLVPKGYYFVISHPNWQNQLFKYEITRLELLDQLFQPGQKVEFSFLDRGEEVILVKEIIFL